jgi:hypothetical protein
LRNSAAVEAVTAAERAAGALRPHLEGTAHVISEAIRRQRRGVRAVQSQAVYDPAILAAEDVAKHGTPKTLGTTGDAKAADPS